MSIRVGLTGGIGSGKSTVASLFSELGVPVIDTDVISHQLTQPGGAAIPEIQAAFGKEFIDENGALNRTKMRNLVFSDNASKLRLEKILHPLILNQVKIQSKSIQAPYMLIVVPLLFESQNYQHWLDRTLTVDCSEQTQLARATKRENLNEQMVIAIMNRQLSRAQRQHLSDDVIDNDGTLSNLRAHVIRLHKQYLDLNQTNN